MARPGRARPGRTVEWLSGRKLEPPRRNPAPNCPLYLPGIPARQTLPCLPRPNSARNRGLLRCLWEHKFTHHQSVKSIKQSINHSINQSLNQTINQSITNQTNQSINQINHSVNQSINQPINQSSNKSNNPHWYNNITNNNL